MRKPDSRRARMKLRRLRRKQSRAHASREKPERPRRWGQGIARHDLSYYVEKIQQRQPFTLARYGDGEWHTILGDYGMRNSNGCTFTPELGSALRGALYNSYPYEHAVLRVARRRLGGRIQRFLAANPRIEIDWTLGDTMLDASLAGRLRPLVEALRARQIVYVGPPWLLHLPEDFFGLVGFIQVPRQNAILKRARVITGVLEILERSSADLIGWSAGLHSKVFIDDIYGELGDDVTQIDFGSMWDPYFGVSSRNYSRSGRHDFKQLLRINTGG